MFDLLGLGLNSLDHLISVERLPAPGAKIEVAAERRSWGGQVATACVVARRFGFAVSCAGTVGDDPAGERQRAELRREGLDLSQLLTLPGAESQQAWIFVAADGERTIVYQRDPRAAFPPEAVSSSWIARGRALLLDGHDAAAAVQAATFARAAGCRVVLDLANVHQDQRADTERLLRLADELIAAEGFPAQLDANLADRPGAEILTALRQRFGLAVAALTLGARGVVALDAQGLHAVPGFVVEAIDTTGAGDVFHGGYLVGLLSGWPMGERIEFAAALAALNCAAWGSRGRIASAGEVAKFRRRAHRAPSPLL